MTTESETSLTTEIFGNNSKFTLCSNMVPSTKVSEFFLFHLETQSFLKFAILCILANFAAAGRDALTRLTSPCTNQKAGSSNLTGAPLN
jgi:hypothetical protein